MDHNVPDALKSPNITLGPGRLDAVFTGSVSIKASIWQESGVGRCMQQEGFRGPSQLWPKWRFGLHLTCHPDKK